MPKIRIVLQTVIKKCSFAGMGRKRPIEDQVAMYPILREYQTSKRIHAAIIKNGPLQA